MLTITKKISLLFLASSIALTSCESIQNTNKTQRTAAIGTAAGAVLGGILGNNLGNKQNSALGAVLGGVIGGVAGGVIGRKMDNQAKKINELLPGAEVERVGEGIRVVLNENSINFDFNKSSLTATAKANLDKLVLVFKENPDTDIKIYGHTDNVGNDAYNQTLSSQRAKAVASYLVSKGLVSSRLTTKGMGEIEPIADNATEVGRAANRRVEFGITANDKMVQDAQKEN